MTNSGSRHRAFWPVALSAAYDSAGYALVGPVLPALRDRAGASALAASVIFAAFSAGMVAGFVIATLGARSRGPRAALIAGIVLHAAADLLFATGTTAAVYGVARVVQGIGSGGLWMGSVLMALAWWPESPRRRIGVILSSYAFGSVAGPLLAALGGTVRPFAADAVLACAALAACLRLPSGPGRTLGWTASALRDGRFFLSSAVVFFSATFYATVEGSFTVLFSDRLSQLGLAVLVAVITLGAGAGALLPFAARGATEGRAVARVGVVACGALVVAATVVGTPVGWFFLLPAAAVCLGAGETGALGLLAGMPAEGLLTATVGNAQAWALGFLLAPPISTLLATKLGPAAPGVAMAAAGVAVGLYGGLVRLDLVDGAAGSGL